MDDFRDVLDVLVRGQAAFVEFCSLKMPAVLACTATSVKSILRSLFDLSTRLTTASHSNDNYFARHSINMSTRARIYKLAY